MDHVRFVGQADRQALWLRSELHDPGRMRCHAAHSADPQKDRRFKLRLLRPCGSRDRHGPGPCVSGQRLMRLARAATAGRGCDEEGRSRHGHLSARAVPLTASAPASMRLGKIVEPCVSGRYQAADTRAGSAARPGTHEPRTRRTGRRAWRKDRHAQGRPCSPAAPTPRPTPSTCAPCRIPVTLLVRTHPEAVQLP